MTLSELQTKRDQLVAALAEPETIQFSDRSVRNRTAADIRAAISQLDAEISAAQSSTEPRLFTVETSRGLE
jgi:hypothetical protein